MKQTKLAVAIKATIFGATLAVAPAAFSADKDLLDILRANGSISQGQYDELMKKSSSVSDEALKKMAWAGKLKIKGDLRVRQELVSGDEENKDRQRIRARIGAYADVADNVKAGLRLATGGSATSGNQDLDSNFTMKDIFLDLAYINWQPVEGLELIGGKMKKPWQGIKTGLIWDGDLNPEGVAARYTTKLGGAKLIASAGHLVQSDSSNDTISEDEKVVFAQLAAKFKLAGAKTKAGISIYDFDAENGVALTTGGGNDTADISLTELFAETKVDLGLPVKFYGQYVKNNDATGVNSGEDTAWLLGAGIKYGNWKASYDYRETELNAVNGAFNDSDFAVGMTASEGSRWKLSYKLSKNFSLATTYYDAEINDINAAATPGDQDVWHIDFKVKF